MSSSDEIDEKFLRSLAYSLLTAVCVNWGLLGILCAQTFAYYAAFPKDGTLAKCLVYGVLALEVAQTSVVSHDVFVALTSLWGAGPSQLDSVHNHWFSVPVAGGICGGIGQLFFAYRIWYISCANSRGAPIIITILAAGSAISALVSTEAFFRAKTFTRLLDGNTGFATIGTWNGIGAICDIVIALVMPYFLMRHGTGMHSTHVTIVKVVRLILETGTFTAVIALLHMSLYFESSVAFIVPGLSLSKVYANVMLILFNNRIKLVEGRSTVNSTYNDREDTFIDRVSEQPPSPSSSAARQTERYRGSTSTVFVGKDRLVFRLTDVPPSPRREKPLAEEASPVDRKRPSLEHDLASSSGTRSEATTHNLTFEAT